MDFAKYNSTPIALSNGDVLRDMQVDSAGRLLVSTAGGAQTAASSQSVTPASDSAPFPVAGPMANNSLATGNPVLIAGSDGSNLRTVMTNSVGALRLGISSGSSTVTGNTLNADGLATTLIGIDTRAFLHYYNGTTLDRGRGDATGMWTHAPASAASSALSGTISTSGGTAPITMTNTTRSEIINPSTGTLWASWGTPAVNGAGSFPINAGGTYSPPDRAAGTLTLLSTAATQPYTVNRFS